MKHNNILLGFALLTFTCEAFAGKDNPQFSDYPVAVSTGPFAKNIALSAEQQSYTNKWKQTMQRELAKPVNFAGHYRLYLSWNGELPKECGDNRWVCGWVIDKTSGEIVSELPEFNENTHYRSYHDNGTPSPEEFEPGFYPNSIVLWMNGNTAPQSDLRNLQCKYMMYTFKENKFTALDKGSPCEVDYGDDPNAPQQ
ncbi:hypothetical protein C1366_26290 [Salmonella enterica]|nr:hypothetical protein [Salmonella enterica]